MSRKNRNRNKQNNSNEKFNVYGVKENIDSFDTIENEIKELAGDSVIDNDTVTDAEIDKVVEEVNETYLNAEKELEKESLDTEIKDNNNDLKEDTNPLQAKIDATKSDIKLKPINSVMSDYISVMSNIRIDPNTGAGKQYELFQLLRSVLETNDIELFNKMMDLVNLYFLVHKDGCLSDNKVARFDFVWPGNNKELKTLLNVGFAIANLADKSTRDKELKLISLQKVVDTNETVLSLQAGERFINYYTN